MSCSRKIGPRTELQYRDSYYATATDTKSVPLCICSHQINEYKSMLKFGYQILKGEVNFDEL